jgi:serine O-acetyltransferase
MGTNVGLMNSPFPRPLARVFPKKMIAKLHLFLNNNLVKPFYLSKIKPVHFIGKILRELLLFTFKCDISPYAQVPYSTRIGHHIGIIIGACKIGENCVIRPNVILGRKDVEDYSNPETLEEKKAKFPSIGSNVIIGANVCILGPIHVGDNSIIGAGSVVTKNVEPHSIYAGVPARRIDRRIDEPKTED